MIFDLCISALLLSSRKTLASKINWNTDKTHITMIMYVCMGTCQQWRQKYFSSGAKPLRETEVGKSTY